MDIARTLLAFGIDHGVGECRDHAHTPPDESEAVEVAISSHAGHTLVRNQVMGELFDRFGERLLYVGPSCGDDGGDVYRWRTWGRWMRLW